MALSRSVKKAAQKVNINGKIIEDPQDIPEHFNDYFWSVFSELDCYELSNAKPVVHEFTVSRQGVLEMLLNLDVRKSAGPDGIPNVFLRRYTE